MRALSEMPYAQARELMVTSEEARLEERCAALFHSLPRAVSDLSVSADDDTYDGERPPTPGERPPTPVHRRPLIEREGGTQRLGRRLRSPARPPTDGSRLTFDDVLEGVSAEGAYECAALEPPERTEADTGQMARKRCKTCSCRLPLTAFASSACQCGDFYCAAHMHKHECTFNFRSRNKSKLAGANPKVEPSKLERL